MTSTAHALEVMVELALANAKQAQREIRATVRDLAQIRDYIDQTAQSKEDTANDQHRHHS